MERLKIEYQKWINNETERKRVEEEMENIQK